jgi:NhaP-type Na+/H+ or K+/H+ antiporter
MNVGFGDALLIVGLLLTVAAALSGLMRGTVLSISVLAVAAGIVLAATDAISIDAGDQAVVHLVELALIVTLFSDGLYVERELLRMHWGPAARAIVVAMPITLGLLSVFAYLVFGDLSWSEAFLLGAVLTPTDPVVTSAVVTAQRVPALVRHTLNLESGLNDGLALPFVLFFLVLAEPGGSAGHEAVKLLGESVAGAAIGIALAVLAGRLLSRLPGGGITRQYEGIYALGLAFVAFGLADVTIGNGLIAAFVAGIALGVAEHDIPDTFSEFNENVSAIFQAVTFFIFGALIVATGYDGSVWALVAFVPFTLLVARPIAIFAALGGTGLARPFKVFIAWFGPKGVASMLFALFVLNSQAPDRNLVFDIASFVILCSIVAHGLTDTLGSRLVERHVPPEASDSAPDGVPGDLTGPG